MRLGSPAVGEDAVVDYVAEPRGQKAERSLGRGGGAQGGSKREDTPARGQGETDERHAGGETSSCRTEARPAGERWFGLGGEIWAPAAVLRNCRNHFPSNLL
ncbi:hypothetical protein ZWY2020_025694 [Hordeum vulgare]|nr:hypothetical protein ZWY2020_025694 [Hordeum vulgare]